MAKINTQTTRHIAQLANIPIQDKEIKPLTQAFSETLQVVDQLQTLSVDNIEPSHQVTGLSNITRPDEVDESSMLSQQQALANAPKHYKGYFVVSRIIEK